MCDSCYPKSVIPSKSGFVKRYLFGPFCVIRDFIKSQFFNDSNEYKIIYVPSSSSSEKKIHTQVILLYMQCRNSPGRSFIPLIFMFYILTYLNMNVLYRIFNIILKSVFHLLSRIYL